MQTIRHEYHGGHRDWDECVSELTALILTGAGIDGSKEVREFRARVSAINFLEPDPNANVC